MPACATIGEDETRAPKIRRPSLKRAFFPLVSLAPGSQREVCRDIVLAALGEKKSKKKKKNSSCLSSIFLSLSNVQDARISKLDRNRKKKAIHNMRLVTSNSSPC